jgi:hypothetical protein
VKLVADPFILYGEFFLERFDKSLADEAEWSDEIGKDPDIHVVECLRKWSLIWNNIYNASRNFKRFFFRRIFNIPNLSSRSFVVHCALFWLTMGIPYGIVVTNLMTRSYHGQSI